MPWFKLACFGGSGAVKHDDDVRVSVGFAAMPYVSFNTVMLSITKSGTVVQAAGAAAQANSSRTAADYATQVVKKGKEGLLAVFRCHHVTTVYSLYDRVS